MDQSPIFDTAPKMQTNKECEGPRMLGLCPKNASSMSALDSARVALMSRLHNCLKNCAMMAIGCAQVLISLQCNAAGDFSIGANFRAVHRDETLNDPVIGGGLNVPDSMGSVGPQHVAVLVNGRYEMYDKAGLPTDGDDATPIIGAAGGLHDFWNSAVDGVTLSSGSHTAFDPRIAYDPSVQRWYAVSGELTLGAGGETRIFGTDVLFARSKSADPTGAWDGVRVPSLTGNPFATDMPTLGFDKDYVYVSLATSPRAVIALPKDDLLNVTPTVENRSQFSPTVISPGLATYLTQAYDGLGPDTQAFHIWNAAAAPSNQSAQFNRIVKNSGVLAIEADTPAESTQFSDDPAPPLPNGARQPSGKHLRTFPDLMSKVSRIGGSYWGTVARQMGNDGVIHWFKIDAVTSALQDGGTISIANHDLIFPSIAVNPRGDTVIGFTATGPNTYPSAYAAVRPAGAVDFETPILLQAGTASYDDGAGNATSRWGDYSATVFDPADPNIFWTFQEWASGASAIDDQWSVQGTEIIVFADDEFYWKDTASGSIADSSRWLGGKGAPGTTDRAVFSRTGAPYGVEMIASQTNQSVSVRQGDVYIGFHAVANGRTYTVTDSISVGEFQGEARLTLYPGLLFSNTVRTEKVVLGSRGELALEGDKLKLERLTGTELPSIEVEIDDGNESGRITFNSTASIQIPDFEFVFSEDYDPQVGDEYTILTNTGTGALEGFYNNEPRLLGNRHTIVAGQPEVANPAEFEISMPLLVPGGQALQSNSGQQLRAGIVEDVDGEGNAILKLVVTFVADFNLDWKVDGTDLGVFAGQSGLQDVVNNIADFDGNGSVDGGDTGVFSGQFGLTYSPGGGGGGVPEPTGFVIVFGWALVAAPFRYARRR